MPKHKLYQMMLNCEDWRSSSKINELSLSATGAYINLLCAAWLTDDCTLPREPAKLKRLSGAASGLLWDALWEELNPLFKERGGRLYNPRQMEEFEKAKKIYKARSKAGSKGGSKTASKPRSTEEAQVPTTHNQQPTMKTPYRTTTEPTPIGDLDEGVLMGAGYHGSLHELQQMVGSGWDTSYGILQWAYLSGDYPHIQECMDYIRHGQDERTREATGANKTENPAGFIISKVRLWAKAQENIVVPSGRKLNQRYTKEI